jgi:thiamine kinase-like enzyme
MGDRFFDLANFSVNHELDGDAQDVLLEAYFGEAGQEHRGHLRAMRFMSDFREAMWGVLQQGISKLDVNFVDYARRHFARLELP